MRRVLPEDEYEWLAFYDGAPSHVVKWKPGPPTSHHRKHDLNKRPSNHYRTSHGRRICRAWSLYQVRTSESTLEAMGRSGASQKRQTLWITAGQSTRDRPPEGVKVGLLSRCVPLESRPT